MKQIIKKTEPFTNGQTIRKITVIERSKIKKQQIIISQPTLLAKSISSVLNVPLYPISEIRDYKDKQIGIEIEKFRWMKPDNNGKLVPK